MGLDLSLHITDNSYIELNQKVRKGLKENNLVSDESLDIFIDFMNMLHEAHYRLNDWFDGVVEYLQGYKQGLAIDFVEQNPEFEKFINDYVSDCFLMSELNFNNNRNETLEISKFVTFIYFNWDMFHEYINKSDYDYVESVIFLEKLMDNFELKKCFVIENSIYSEKELIDWQKELDKENKSLTLYFSY